MQFKTNIVILGAKPQDITVDGKKYDATKIYVNTELKDGIGYATTEYNWGTSANYEQLKNKQFPLQAEATMEIVTNGKKTTTTVVDIKPLPPLQPPK